MDFSNENVKIVPAPFLTKTYELVDDVCTNHIVSWGEDDSTFVVWRPPEFARDLLPNYFKHNNFSSFVRQLNTYGFKKIVADKWEFANEYFRKGSKHLLSQIHRRKTHHHHNHHDQPPQFLYPSDEPTFYHHHHSPIEPTPKPNTDILTALTRDNQQLRRKNFMLVSELTHMKNLYNDIIFFIQNNVKPIPFDQTSKNNEKFIDLGSSFQPQVSLSGCGSGKSSSSLNDKDKSSSVKLFGVNLTGKKRFQPENIDHLENESRFSHYQILMG